MRAGAGPPLVGLLCVAAATASPPAGLAAQASDASLIVGRVLDEVGGRAVVGAEVGIEGARGRAITGADGAFRLQGIPPGTHVVWTRGLGYAERRDSVEVPPATVLQLTVVLPVDALAMEPLVVEIRSPVLQRHGFYDRRAQGYGGFFIDEADIRMKDPDRVTDLFKTVPGITVRYGGLYGSQVFVNQRVTFSDGRDGCLPDVWLDGVRSTLRSFDMMRADEIAGIEIYTGGTAPGKFNDLCGTVAVWTKSRR